MRRNFCQACSFNANGVRTRIAIEHTCGLENPPPRIDKHREPTKEDLYLYLARLKELMEPGSEPYVPSRDSDNAELKAKKLSNEDSPL